MSDELSVSPFAPQAFPPLPPIAGMHIFAEQTGVKYTGRPDFLLAEFSETARVAGVFTSSKMPSAPVDLARQNLLAGGGRIRGLGVNAGKANAFTGTAGARAAGRTAEALAKRLRADETEIFLASTGVIGETLDAAPLVAAVLAAGSSYAVEQAIIAPWRPAAPSDAEVEEACAKAEKYFQVTAPPERAGPRAAAFREAADRWRDDRRADERREYYRAAATAGSAAVAGTWLAPCLAQLVAFGIAVVRDREGGSSPGLETT